MEKFIQKDKIDCSLFLFSIFFKNLSTRLSSVKLSTITFSVTKIYVFEYLIWLIIVLLVFLFLWIFSSEHCDSVSLWYPFRQQKSWISKDKGCWILSELYKIYTSGFQNENISIRIATISAILLILHYKCNITITL